MLDLKQENVESLSERIHTRWRDELLCAVEKSHSIGQDGPGICSENLSWAVAWLVNDSLSKNNAFSKLMSSVGDIDELFFKLTAELVSADRVSSPIAELMSSVACEQNVQWHSPAVQEQSNLHIEKAKISFDHLCKVHHRRVLKSCRSMAKNEPEDLAMEAWAGLFKSYWSGQSKTRWGGLCQVSTLGVAAARRLSWKSSNKDGVALDPGAAFTSSGISPSERQEIQIAYESCRDKLPGKQRVCVELLLQRGVPQTGIAEVMGCGKSNVANLLKTALGSLRTCLAIHGYSEMVEVVHGK